MQDSSPCYDLCVIYDALRLGVCACRACNNSELCSCTKGLFIAPSILSSLVLSIGKQGMTRVPRYQLCVCAVLIGWLQRKWAFTPFRVTIERPLISYGNNRDGNSMRVHGPCSHKIVPRPFLCLKIFTKTDERERERGDVEVRIEERDEWGDQWEEKWCRTRVESSCKASKTDYFMLVLSAGEEYIIAYCRNCLEDRYQSLSMKWWYFFLLIQCQRYVLRCVADISFTYNVFFKSI